ncbi:hypothetical protein DAPPUDRAFT_317439 [Daphnia pulex]|uniref:DNA topoisomerase (ATP-hydrolyzing) n=1 Tax=Daphnia pulex TaxID=6669 RepID=E9GFZ8_DAPPU|nr:hypothetical protein DAPPUDRAFT_317439 [Daphnia pulex]|eukprot:EFX81583.1 hypothetical protein DAPPUDRAFT_317439 [Daphnia pulex]
MRQLRDCLFPSDQASKGVTGSMIHDTVQSTQLGQSMGRSVPGTPLSTGVPSLGNLTNVQQILSGIQASKGGTASMVHDTVQSPQLGQEDFKSRGNLIKPLLLHAIKGTLLKMSCEFTKMIAIIQREVTVVPGLYQIFDELLVNATENKIKDISMDTTRVDIDLKSNIIKMFYQWRRNPVVEKEEAKIIQRTVQTIQTGMANQQCNIPEIRTYSGSSFTEITFSLDLGKFKMDALD